MVKLLCLMFISNCLLAKPSFMVKPHVLYFLMAEPHFLRLQNPAFFMVKVSKSPLSWWFNLVKPGETLRFAGWKASANARSSCRWPPQHSLRLASEKRTSGGEKEKSHKMWIFFCDFKILWWFWGESMVIFEDLWASIRFFHDLDGIESDLDLVVI